MKSNFWPSVNFSISTRSSYNDLAPDSFSDQYFDRNRNSSVGLSLNFPIFDRFLTRNTVQQANIQLRNVQLDMEDMRQDVALQVRQAYLDYLTDEKRLDVTAKQFRASEQALEAEQERYNVGVSTLVELTQARATYEQSSSDKLEARYNFVFRKKLIEYYIGVLDPTGQLFR
ncbi:MAG: TolC family protein [Bacteroidetes bacterium]|nr:TolC family protein [Bacteroidota bacterium]